MKTHRDVRRIAGTQPGTTDANSLCHNSRERLALRLVHPKLILLGLLSLGVLSGCVADGGYESGYDTGAYVGYGVDYYDAPGYVYGGGWRPGYRVGPPRRGEWEHRPSHLGRPESESAPDRSGRPGYRPAPSSRPMPSIPSAPRGGGGGHFGGGGHRGGRTGPRF